MKMGKHAATYLMGTTFAVSLSLAPAATLWADPPDAAAPPPSSMAAMQSAYGQLPLSFEANQGQTDARVNYLARGEGYTLWLTPSEALLALRPPGPTSSASPSPAPSLLSGTGREEGTVLHLQLQGATHTTTLSGLDELPGKANYFIGNDPKKWRTKIPTFAKVQYENAYPGIDLVYYGNQGKLEYDFIVAPGADPNQIKLAFDGASDIKVADSGDLMLTTALGDVRMQKPIVYQLEQDGHKTFVVGHYVVNAQSMSLHASRTASYSVGFQLASYDHAKPLVIDPVLLYSTYLGGSTNDVGQGIAVDAAGQVYVAGSTISTNFPTATPLQPTFGGVQDAFVTKLSATGSLLYSSFLGGSGNDIGAGIAVDAAGQAYVTGETTSLDFPTATPLQATNAGSFDAFVTKLSAAGTSLLYSTYLGGSLSERGLGIVVDAASQAYVTGITPSANFPTFTPLQPTFGGVQDAFVTKLSATGSLLYSTFLGGSHGEHGRGIAVDAVGQAYVTGITQSSDFPTLMPLQATYGGGTADVFVTKLSAAGSLLYSTFLGGNDDDEGQAIAVDTASQVYVTGFTVSTNFPTTTPLQPTLGGVLDAFVTKLSFDQSPVCSAAVANPASLWSPDHQFVPVVVMGVTDPDGDSLTITVTAVTQDEPVNAQGDGNTSPDAVIQAGSASVRAERSGNGNGRVYQVSFTANDGKGGSCSGAVTVTVPHSQKKGLIAIDDGQIYNSTIP